MRIQFSSILATLISIQLATACTTSSGGETPAEESFVESGSDQAASIDDSINGGDDKGLELNDGAENKDSAASSSLAENSVSVEDSPDATLSSPDAPMPADSLPSAEESSDLSKELSDTPSPSLPDETPASSSSELPINGSDDKAQLENSTVEAERSINQDIMRITFGRNSSKLSSDAKAILSQIAERMKSESSLKIKLQGFTDSRGSVAQNKRLAKSRAKAVKAALVSMGVQKNRVMIGEEHALNRRVEVIFK